MINDIIQLLGIANPQLSKFWTLTGKTTATTAVTVAADGFTVSCAAADEWCAPCTGILTENQHHTLLQMPDGSTPATGIVLQMSPQVFLAMNHLYANIIEGKAAGASSDRPVPKYFLFSGNTKLAWVDDGDNKTGPDAGLFLPGDQLHLRGNLTIHDEEGIVIDPVAVANAFDTFMQLHWSLEYKSIGDAAPAGAPPLPFTAQAQRQTFNMAQTGGNQKRMYFTDIFNKPFPTASFPFGNATLVPGTSVHSLTAAGAITKNAGTNALLQMAVSTNGLFANQVTYPATPAPITLQRDYIRIKVANWNEHLLGDVPGNIPAAEPTKANTVMPVVRENELIQFCMTGNECLGKVGNIVGGASVEKMLTSTNVQTDFVLPPNPNAAGNHLWPAFSQGLPTNTAAIPASIKNNITATAHFITNNANDDKDVYLEIKNRIPPPPLTPGSQLQNGWAVRVYHRVFHPDGTETRGDGGGTIIQNNTAAFIVKDPFKKGKPFTQVNNDVNPVLMFDMVIINAANPVQSRRFGNIAATVAVKSALSGTEPLLGGNNTLNTVPNIGISPAGFLGVKTSAGAINGITNFTAYIRASGNDVQPRQAPALPTQSRLEGLAASKTAANWSAFNGGLRAIKESRENALPIGNPGSPGGSDIHTTGIITSNGRLAYDIARAALRRSQNFSERMKRLVNNTAYVLPAPSVAGTFVGAVLQTISKRSESPRLEEFQQIMTNLPADATALKNDIQALLTNDTKPAWLPDSIKAQFKTAMTGTPAAASHQLAFEELRREYSSSLNGRRDSFYSIKNAFQNARHFIYIESSFFGPTKYPATPGGAAPADDLIEVLLQQLLAKPGLRLIICVAQEIPYNRGYDNIARFHQKNRNDSIVKLLGTQDPVTHKYQRHQQVVAYHPLAFPGRPLKINTQCIVVDDVWAIVGSSNISQRGMYFDGSTDVVFADKQLKSGKGTAITNFRRQLMQQYLRMDNALPNLPASNQVFLQNGRSAFEMLRTLLDGGGGAMIKEFAPETLNGISAAQLSALNNLADPNGDTFYQSQAVLQTWLAELSTVPE